MTSGSARHQPPETPATPSPTGRPPPNPPEPPKPGVAGSARRWGRGCAGSAAEKPVPAAPVRPEARHRSGSSGRHPLRPSPKRKATVAPGPARGSRPRSPMTEQVFCKEANKSLALMRSVKRRGSSRWPVSVVPVKLLPVPPVPWRSEIASRDHGNVNFTPPSKPGPPRGPGPAEACGVPRPSGSGRPRSTRHHAAGRESHERPVPAPSGRSHPSAGVDSPGPTAPGSSRRRTEQGTPGSTRIAAAGGSSSRGTHPQRFFPRSRPGDGPGRPDSAAKPDGRSPNQGRLRLSVPGSAEEGAVPGGELPPPIQAETGTPRTPALRPTPKARNPAASASTSRRAPESTNQHHRQPPGAVVAFLECSSYDRFPLRAEAYERMRAPQPSPQDDGPPSRRPGAGECPVVPQGRPASSTSSATPEEPDRSAAQTEHPAKLGDNTPPHVPRRPPADPPGPRLTPPKPYPPSPDHLPYPPNPTRLKPSPPQALVHPGAGG